MKIKTATLLGMIGATITLVLDIFYIMLNTKVVSLVNEEWDYEKQEHFYMIFNTSINLLSTFSAFTLLLFFFVLYKNQKN
jgi:hypothetical protein